MIVKSDWSDIIYTCFQQNYQKLMDKVQMKRLGQYANILLLEFYTNQNFQVFPSTPKSLIVKSNM